MDLGLATEVLLPSLARMIVRCFTFPSTFTASKFDAIRLPIYRLRPNQSNAIVYGAPTIPESPFPRNSVLFPPPYGLTKIVHCEQEND